MEESSNLNIASKLQSNELRKILDERQKKQCRRIAIITTVVSLIVVALFVAIVVIAIKLKPSGISSGSENDNINTDDNDNNGNNWNNSSNDTINNNPENNDSIPIVPPNNSTNSNSSMISPYLAYPAYLNAHKALYTWSHSINKKVDQKAAWLQLAENYQGSFNNYIDFLQQHKFKKVYHFAGSVEWEYDDYFKNHKMPSHNFFKSNLQRLDKAGIEIELAFYLNDEVNNLTEYQRIKDVAETVKQLNNEVPIKAVHLDQEPSDPKVYNSLIKMMQLSNSIYSTSSTIKPLWINQRLADIKQHFDSDVLKLIDESNATTFAELVMYVTDSSEMMSYSNKYEKIEEMNLKYLQQVKNMNKKGTIIIETGFINNLPEEETLCWTMKKDQNAFFQFIANTSAKHGSIVIHDYLQYYYDLYCYYPEHYQGAGANAGTQHKTMVTIVIYVVCIVYTVLMILLNLFCTEEIHKQKKKAMNQKRAQNNMQMDKHLRETIFSSQVNQD